MMEFQPNITATDLNKIKCPVLVMSTDRDIIPEEHTLFLYRNISKANLCILTGENHYVTKNNPDLFNSIVGKYSEDNYKGRRVEALSTKATAYIRVATILAERTNSHRSVHYQLSFGLKNINEL